MLHAIFCSNDVEVCRTNPAYMLVAFFSSCTSYRSNMDRKTHRASAQCWVPSMTAKGMLLRSVWVGAERQLGAERGWEIMDRQAGAAMP